MLLRTGKVRETQLSGRNLVIMEGNRTMGVKVGVFGGGGLTFSFSFEWVKVEFKCTVRCEGIRFYEF